MPPKRNNDEVNMENEKPTSLNIYGLPKVI